MDSMWNNTNNGELGQNDEVNRSSPTQIPGTQWDYESVSGGDLWTGIL